MLLSKQEFNNLSLEERVEYIHAQDSDTLNKMVEKEYIYAMTRDRLLRKRGELSPERQVEIDAQHRKMARKLGAVAANVR